MIRLVLYLYFLLSYYAFHFFKRLYFLLELHAGPEGSWRKKLHLFITRHYRSKIVHSLSPTTTASATHITHDIPVAFRITGGVGDHLIAARYIRDLMAVTGTFTFDIFTLQPESVVHWIFKGFPEFNEHYDEYFSFKERCGSYPLVLWITNFVTTYKTSTPNEELLTHNKALAQVIESIERYAENDIPVFIENHPGMDNFLGRKAVFLECKRHNFAQYISKIPYGGDKFPIATAPEALAKFSLEGKKYITLHNGFDAMTAARIGKNNTSTKCYPHYDALIKLLRAHMPDMYFVQLGTKTSIPIEGIDLNLLNLTTLAETAAIIEKATLHIDNESGLVHLASCLGTTSSVLFGPTDAQYFGYEQNINIRPAFCGNCWWITEDWMRACARKFEGPRCLSEQSPESVANHIITHLTPQLQVIK